MPPLRSIFASLWLGACPGKLCRMDASLAARLLADADDEPLSVSWSLLIVAGMACFGAAVGAWRSPLQALYGALKMPLMLHAVAWLSVAANAMLNWLLGGGLSLRQVRRCILAAFAVQALLLGSLSPVFLFFASQLPGPESWQAYTVYRHLLAALVVSVGAAGVVGYARLFRLLAVIAPDRLTAGRVWFAWVLTTGLVGAQCSWMLSPFVQQPDAPIPFWNSAAFSGNFFEHVWFHLLNP